MGVEDVIELLYLVLAEQPAAQLPREELDALLSRHLGTNVVTLRARIGSSRMLMPSGRLWTSEDVQAYLGVGRTWVQEATDSGALPCVRVSERVTRYRREDVTAFAESRVRGGRPPTGTGG